MWQACEKKKHYACGMQTWCECECDGDFSYPMPNLEEEIETINKLEDL